MKLEQIISKHADKIGMHNSIKLYNSFVKKANIKYGDNIFQQKDKYLETLDRYIQFNSRVARLYNFQ
jgi:hypothetical protein